MQHCGVGRTDITDAETGIRSVLGGTFSYRAAAVALADRYAPGVRNQGAHPSVGADKQLAIASGGARYSYAFNHDSDTLLLVGLYALRMKSANIATDRPIAGGSGISLIIRRIGFEKNKGRAEKFKIS